MFSKALKKPVAAARVISTGIESVLPEPPADTTSTLPRVDSEKTSSKRRMEPIPREGQNTAEPTVRTSIVNLIDGIPAVLINLDALYMIDNTLNSLYLTDWIWGYQLILSLYYNA